MGSKTDDWRQVPLGIAVVDATMDGGLAASHVSVTRDGVAQSGMWHFESPQPAVLNSILAHWVVIGTRDGVALTEDIMGQTVATGDLAGLVHASQAAEAEMVAAWQAYKDEEPLKRSNLVALNAGAWPVITDDGDAADILSRVGVSPYSGGTPPLMRDSLALTRLVSFVLNVWWELETARLSRPYLTAIGGPERRLLPPNWVAENPPWWPKREG